MGGGGGRQFDYVSKLLAVCVRDVIESQAIWYITTTTVRRCVWWEVCQRVCLIFYYDFHIQQKCKSKTGTHVHCCPVATAVTMSQPKPMHEHKCMSV